MANEKEKVFVLAKEMATNNKGIAEQVEKQKTIKEVIKAYQERNAAIVDELAVHTEEDNF